jgi:preprotein translocase subunit SecA
VDREELTAVLQDEALGLYEQRESELGSEIMRELERYLLLEIIDQRWREHLYDLDYLQQGIGLRAAAQEEPLVAYKNDAFRLFGDLMNNIWGDFARMIFHVQVVIEGADGGGAQAPVPARPSASSSSTRGGNVSYSGGVAPAGALALAAAASGMPDAGMAGGVPGVVPNAGVPVDFDEEPLPAVEQRRVDHEHNLGRNDPCWCGSGKKFKKCHGA